MCVWSGNMSHGCGPAKRHTNAWKHWCPKGCGRKVVYDSSGKDYVCVECKNRCTKEELL